MKKQQTNKKSQPQQSCGVFFNLEWDFISVASNGGCTHSRNQEKNPLDDIVDILEVYDEGTPPRKNIMGTWGE